MSRTSLLDVTELHTEALHIEEREAYEITCAFLSETLHAHVDRAFSVNGVVLMRFPLRSFF